MPITFIWCVSFHFYTEIDIFSEAIVNINKKNPNLKPQVAFNGYELCALWLS